MPASRLEVDIRIENRKEDTRTVRVMPSDERWKGLLAGAVVTFENGKGELDDDEEDEEG